MRTRISKFFEPSRVMSVRAWLSVLIGVAGVTLSQQHGWAPIREILLGLSHTNPRILEVTIVASLILRWILLRWSPYEK